MTLLGDFSLKTSTFPSQSERLSALNKSHFTFQPYQKKFRLINELLFELIEDAPAPNYLLPAVISFIAEVNERKLLNKPYHFYLFEFWLNEFSGVSKEKNYELRGKIAGKFISREDYQGLYPVGSGKIYDGTHFVAAHLSPDIDTTIGSFWGWVDALAARVGNGLHIWNLPGGPPDAPVTKLFENIFGRQAFSLVARQSSFLSISSLDLVTRQNVILEKGSASITALDHGYKEKAVLLTDEEGYYLGDWRSADLEKIRQISVLFEECLRWFENNFHAKLISFFADPAASMAGIPRLYASILEIRFKNIDPLQSFTEKQRSDLDSFLKRVLNYVYGLEGTFTDFFLSLERLSIQELAQFQNKFRGLGSSGIFDEAGKIKDDRPAIFSAINELITLLDRAICEVKKYLGRLDVAMAIKSQVLQKSVHVLSERNDIEDIKLKMIDYDYLTVADNDGDKIVPLGVIWNRDLHKSSLGTASFRDFCNFEEVKLSPYISVISVIDHHKSTLRTPSVPLAIIGDTQSCNVLIAEQALAINARYSLGGMEPALIDKQITELQSMEETPSTTRRLQKLLNKKMALKRNGRYYVDSSREMIEYFFFIHAILDDTDLLNKVTNRDVDCVASLLNAFKTIVTGRESEIIQLDDIPRDNLFAKTAAARILQNEDMYSLYKQIYATREKDVEENLALCAEGKPSNIFSDTKEQNGCCRIGQTKLFHTNIELFKKSEAVLQQYWVKKAQERWKANPELDLHIHMISTIPSAAEVYQGKLGQYDHQDEFWIWIPEAASAQDHLGSFLSSFQTSKEAKQNHFSLKIKEGAGKEYILNAFKLDFPPIPITITPSDAETPGLAILRFDAGSLNSRKAMVTPYLPRRVS